MRNQSTIQMLVALVTALLVGTFASIPEVAAQCASCASGKKLCKTDKIGNDGVVRCRRLCCDPADACGVVTEGTEKYPYCKKSPCARGTTLCGEPNDPKWGTRCCNANEQCVTAAPDIHGPTPGRSQLTPELLDSLKNQGFTGDKQNDSVAMCVRK